MGAVCSKILSETDLRRKYISSHFYVTDFGQKTPLEQKTSHTLHRPFGDGAGEIEELLRNAQILRALAQSVAVNADFDDRTG
jgi:hypothetical protein